MGVIRRSWAVDAFVNRQSKLVLGLWALLLGLAFTFLPLPWLLLLPAATAVLLLIFRYPLAGLGLALLAGPFGALERIALGNNVIDSGQLLLWLTLAAWLARGALRRRIVIPYTPLNGPLLLFIGAAALTLPGTLSPIEGLKELLKWLEIAAIVWLVVAMRDEWPAAGSGKPGTPLPSPLACWPTRQLITGLLVALLVAGLLQALLGIWQFGLRGQGPEHFLIMGRFYRAYGSFEQPNPFGGYMGLNATLALGTAVGLLAALGTRPWLDWRAWLARWPAARPLTLFVLFCAGATSLALLLSWSRGAWLGFGAALLAPALLAPRRRHVALGLLLIVAAAGWLAFSQEWLPATISGRLTGFSQDFQLGDVRGVAIHDANYAVLERLAYWQAAVNMAQDHFWLGVGFGNYAVAYSAYALINWPLALGHAHNYYLNLLAETGILGLSAYLLLWTAVFGQTIRVINRHEWPQRGIALGLLAAWIYLSVHHLVDKLYVNNIYIHLGVMLALLQLLDAERVNERQRAANRARSS